MGTPEGCCSRGCFYVSREVVWLTSDASVTPSQKPHIAKREHCCSPLCPAFTVAFASICNPHTPTWSAIQEHPCHHCSHQHRLVSAISCFTKAVVSSGVAGCVKGEKRAGGTEEWCQPTRPQGDSKQWKGKYSWSCNRKCNLGKHFRGCG